MSALAEVFALLHDHPMHWHQTCSDDRGRLAHLVLAASPFLALPEGNSCFATLLGVALDLALPGVAAALLVCVGLLMDGSGDASAVAVCLESFLLIVT